VYHRSKDTSIEGFIFRSLLFTMLDTKCKKLEYINEANFTKNLET